ncbi:Carboxylesterase NlhH [BD1-7 clade bacterium]|uniref:Carboxylesterase NlhH n=1 Tax=BD1-7 clade bacterium TaxID=2029982 RepID=A0A5S9PH26_9GAMM|nr:Carboxylesterase NlhH [BD1-7 clade bacterium]CAA0103432.1 Carboxylesterase NlhH [BD1-7 clade bacterium]
MNLFKAKMMRFVIRLIMRICWWGKRPTKHSEGLVSAKRTEETIAVNNGCIRAFVYTPTAPAPRPIIVYYHGGGFVVGDIDAYDPVCRDICEKSGCLVVSIDYRLAPEYTCPTAADDSLAGLEWVMAYGQKLGGDPTRIFVAGDSAGGNLAAVTALQARDQFPETIKGQILIYPVTDHYSAETASYSENATGQGLTRNQMIWFWDQYLPSKLPKHDLATPLTLSNHTDLPPALVITAELDPLRDEGNAYAEKLLNSQVDVQDSMYRGEQHGFFGSFGPGKAHQKALSEIVTWIEKQSDKQR